MILQYSPWFLPFLLSAIVTGALAVESWRRLPNSPVVPPFFALTVAMTLWSLGDALEVVTADLSTSQLINTLSYIGMEAVPLLFLLLALVCTGNEHLLTRRNILVVALVPVLIVLLVATNDHHHLFYTGYLPVRMDGYVVWQYLHGPLFAPAAGFNYLVLFASILLLASRALVSSGAYRRQLLVIVAGSLLPILANVAYVLQDRLVTQYYSLTGIAFAVSVLLIAPAIFRYRVLSLIPVSSPQVIAAMQDGVVAVDPWGRVTDLNPAAERVLAASSSCLGERVERIFPAAVPLLEAVRSGGTEVHARMTLTRAGDDRVHEVSVLPIRTAGGTDRGYLLILHDITDRTRAFEALRESEVRYRELVDLLPEVVFEADADGRLRFVNSRALRVFGWTPAEVQAGLSLVDGLDEEERTRVLAEIRRTCEGGGQGRVGFRAVGRDGSRRPVMMVAAPMTAGGTAPGILGILVDMTEQQRATDAQKEALRRMALLNSITRHDIQNQLTVLSGSLDLAREPDPEAARAGFDRAERALTLIEALVTFIGDYQEIGARSSGWQDLGPIIERVGRSPLLDGVRVIPPDGQVEIYADPLFEKVVYNLVENAIRHGERVTRIVFSVRAEPDRLVIVCEDDGAGVPAGEKEAIFSKGYGRNTGLGLYLSRQILAITGMTIVENGTPGGGARFEIAVPRGHYRYA